MKHLYIAAALAATVTVSAWSATQRPEMVKSVSEPSVLSLQSKPQKFAESILITESTGAVSRASINKAPEGDWKAVSTGVWVEGPLASIYSDVQAGKWDVTVEENADVPGWYRVQPYASPESTPAALIGRTDETYLYFNATDSSRVYFEQWAPFGILKVTSYTAEGGWSMEPEEGTYGTLENGVISFPENAIAYTTDDTSWYYLSGTVELHLNKDEAKFYGVEFDVPFCCDVDERATIRFTKEEDVASVKLMFASGVYEMSDDNAQIVASEGTEVVDRAETGIEFQPSSDEKGVFSVMYVSLDSEGNVKDSGVKYMFVQNEDSENWESIGQGTMAENILSSLFSDIYAETVNVDIEENVNVKGYYRIKNAYSNHSSGFAYTCDKHNHYLYIHAETPDRVYLDCSTMGVEISRFGKFAAYSLGLLYIGTNIEEVAADQGYFGVADEKTITLPAERIMVCLSDYEDGQFLWIQNPEIVITLPERVGIESIETIGNETQEYYNLQGVRVDKPVAGGLYILRQGSKAVKIIR